jgi:heterodisulfide reductase subunit A2
MGDEMKHSSEVLIIGAGIAGMKASLMLAGASKKVHLVERLPIIGGNVIKNEESFPNMECSTCMVAPIQQDVLQNPLIQTYTHSSVEEIGGCSGNFKAVIRRKARYVSLTDCIGCGMCFEPCPVSLRNEWEENLMERKAIYVPCSGSLPNVPVIDAAHCLRLNGDDKECSLCQESCAFAAIDLEDKDQVVEINVGAVIIATGAGTFDLSKLPDLGYGNLTGVYAPLEFERLFASNGPTQGEIVLRGSGKSPERVAIVHCAGRSQVGYCSSVCCMYSFKFVRFLKHKLPDAKIHNIYSDVCAPGKSYQNFYTSLGDDTQMIFTPSPDEVGVMQSGEALVVNYKDAGGDRKDLEVDMVILASAIVPDPGLGELSGIADVQLDKFGFVRISGEGSGSMETSRPGVFVAGTACGSSDIQGSVIQAEAAAGQVISLLSKAAIPEERSGSSAEAGR